MVAYGAQLVARCWDEGRPEDVIEKLQEMVRSYPSVYAWKGALAISYLQIGRPDEARRAFEQLASRDFSNMPWNEAGTINFCFLAEIAATLNDAKRARLLYEILLPAASHFAVVGFASVIRGSIARPLALLAATLGRDDEADTHFELALQQDARIGGPFFIAQTQHDYARFLLGRANPKDLKKAKALVSEALESAARLELPHMRDKLLAVQSELPKETATVS